MLKNDAGHIINQYFAKKRAIKLQTLSGNNINFLDRSKEFMTKMLSRKQ